jgi:putative transposase
MATPTEYNLGRNIKNCLFSFRDSRSVKISQFLGVLDLSPISDMMGQKYADKWHYRFSPLAMVRTVLFMKLKGIRFQTQLIKHLESHEDDVKNLGFVKGPKGNVNLPSRRAVNHFMNTRCDERIGGLVDFLFKEIKEQSKSQGIVFDTNIFKDKPKGKVSDRSTRRLKSQRLGEMCKFVRKEIYPHIEMDVSYNSVYKKNVFLDMLTHVAMTKDFTENGSLTFDAVSVKKTPSADALLYHLKKYEDREAVKCMFEKVGEIMFGVAKNCGFLDRTVDVAIDYTEHPYYGDYQDEMVARTRHQKGTSSCFRYATINIVSKRARFTLMALPVRDGDRKEHIVRDLITFAKSRLKIRYIYLDRGFYSVSVLNLLKYFGMKFIIPARRTPTMKRAIDRFRNDGVVSYTMTGTDRRKTFLRLAVVINDDGTKFGFITNMNAEDEDAKRISILYKQRWGIETSYRMKNVFRAKTTSKNYVIRLFYFMYSVLLYNLWIIINMLIGKFIYDEVPESPLITAKFFATVLYMSLKVT